MAKKAKPARRTAKKDFPVRATHAACNTVAICPAQLVVEMVETTDGVKKPFDKATVDIASHG